MIEAVIQIGEHFAPAMPDMCFGGKVAHQCSPKKEAREKQTLGKVANLSLKHVATPGDLRGQAPWKGK